MVGVNEKVLAEMALQRAQEFSANWENSPVDVKICNALKRLHFMRDKYTQQQWDHKYPDFNMYECENYLTKITAE